MTTSLEVGASSVAITLKVSCSAIVSFETERETWGFSLLSKYKVTSSTGAVALVISDTVKTMVSNTSTKSSAGMVAVEIVSSPLLAPAGIVMLWLLTV